MVDGTHLTMSVLGGCRLLAAPGQALLGQTLDSFHSCLFGDLWKGRFFLSW